MNVNLLCKGTSLEKACYKNKWGQNKKKEGGGLSRSEDTFLQGFSICNPNFRTFQTRLFPLVETSSWHIYIFSKSQKSFRWHTQFFLFVFSSSTFPFPFLCSFLLFFLALFFFILLFFAVLFVALFFLVAHFLLLLTLLLLLLGDRFSIYVFELCISMK